MNSKKHPDFFQKYYHYIKIFFNIAIVFLLLFAIIAMTVFPDERDILESNCRLYDGEWFQILDDGSKVPVEVPGKVDAEHGEIVSITTTIPEDIKPGECLTFRSIWQDVKIYVDGELRVDYSTDASRPFGENSTMRYHFVEIGADDIGKDLVYECVSDSKYTGDFRVVYVGDRFSNWLFLFNDGSTRLIVASFLMFLSVFCIVVCIVLYYVYKKSLSINYLAWALFFCSLWMLSESSMRQLVVKNISILTYFTYWCLMMIPIPLVTYINEIQNHRYHKLYSIQFAYSSTLLIVSTLLQVFNIVEFVDQLIFIHFGLISAIIFLIVTIAIDTTKKHITDYLYVGIGLYGMLFTAIVEILMYYFGADLTLGTVLAVGLMFLLVMAIIKTGQDLFKSEKIKQQAVSAKEAQTKFITNMSHEIRTPINAIIGMNEMIMRENEDSAIENYSSNIQIASNMLLGLINDILDFSKIEAGQMELIEDEYQLASLIQQEILLLNTRASDKPISIMIDIDNNLPSTLYGDELHIKQIVTNIISNAVKYTEQGSITVKIFSENIDAENMLLGVTVIDTGIGIKEDELPKLFDSFKRLDSEKTRAIQGTGLGLNIAKQLTDLMKGNIYVESEYGKGSKFTVTIPQKIINKEPIGKLNIITKKSNKDKKSTQGQFTAPDAKVLIVDDNAMNLALMRGLLKRTKMSVDLADSGNKCLELCKDKKYDIIFMDHMMPELDGIETLELLHKQDDGQNKDTTVIVLTANVVAGCREMYIEKGFDDYFPKPIQADKLEELLINYLPDDLISYNE